MLHLSNTSESSNDLFCLVLTNSPKPQRDWISSHVQSCITREYKNIIKKINDFNNLSKSSTCWEITVCYYSLVRWEDWHVSYIKYEAATSYLSLAHPLEMRGGWRKGGDHSWPGIVETLRSYCSCQEKKIQLKNPHKTTTCCFYMPLFGRIKQMRNNMLISDL